MDIFLGTTIFALFVVAAVYLVPVAMFELSFRKSWETKRDFWIAREQDWIDMGFPELAEGSRCMHEEISLYLKVARQHPWHNMKFSRCS